MTKRISPLFSIEVSKTRNPSCRLLKPLSAIFLFSVFCRPLPHKASPKKTQEKPTIFTGKMEQNLPNLPRDIIFDILSRLPVKPLCRFKSVSKLWLASITDPQFIKSHLHQKSIKHEMNQKLILAFCNSGSLYSLDYQATDQTVAKLELPIKSLVRLLGSFHGILLLGIADLLCLWNPSIRMYQKFSPPKYGGGDIPIYGLGYDSVGDDFKVVRLIKPSRNNNRAHSYYSFMNDPPYAVHVFSSKLSSWKSIGEFGYTRIRSPATVANGAPHWVVRHRVVSDTTFSLTTLIVCFNATEETFKEVPKPNCEGENVFIHLGVLGGWLCVTKSHPRSHVDVWVMKEYGVKESWTKLFVVPHVHAGGDSYFNYFTVLGYTKDGELVMRLNSNKLVIYDPKQNKYKRIGIPENSEQFVVDSYVESLVSPYGYDDTRRRR